jgi:hypothetical protein
MALSYGGFHLWEYTSGGKYVSYLQNNSETKHLGESFDFRIMDEDIQKSKLILAGEIHGFQEPQDFDLEFFKYLHQNHGVNKYLAELDFVQAHLLNQFLESGNQKLLHKILNKWVVAQGRNNKSYFEKYIQFYEYYQSLPMENKFQFVGIDKIQDWSLITEFIGDYTKNKMIEIENRSDIEKLLQNIDTIILDYDGVKDSLQMLYHMQSNIQYSLDKVGREEIMYNNFMEYFSNGSFGQSKLYGFFGLFHVMQYRVNGNQPFASLVRQSDLGLVEKILSINFVMNNSYMVMPSKQLPEFIRDKGNYTKMPVSADNMLIMYMIGIKDFKRVTPEYHKSIFKMNSIDSPYGSSSRLNKSIQLLPVTDLFELNDKGKPYVQYTVFVRNSDWAEPYNK